MIPKAEIKEAANRYRLTSDIIEKDYVLGWLLNGIFSNPNLANNWIFKGGTSIKKCYFKDYRFSEDLDFTLTDDCNTSTTFITKQLEQVVTTVADRSGIEITGVTVDSFPDSAGKVLRGKIAYIGPMQQRGSAAKIKLDLTQDEFIVGPSVLSDVFHPYSDYHEPDFKIRSYSYEEIFAEKTRALVQRARPRDLYDVLNLYDRREEFCLNPSVFKQIIVQKFDFKGVPLPSANAIISTNQKNE